MLAVISARHGYAIMQYVHELTKERIKLGTGTLYTMVGCLMADGLEYLCAYENPIMLYKVKDSANISEDLKKNNNFLF